ncbi:hypothetical protein WJX72_004547 [[Myrmecia] bisecta]|uniref:YchJ-like middle NTF2-like domain-containing protein n=1 Tax=[Myrmecia] bisecta TaxID=41462 RepID=A0AAW1QQ92_9CHLO
MLSCGQHVRLTGPLACPCKHELTGASSLIQHCHVPYRRRLPPCGAGKGFGSPSKGTTANPKGSKKSIKKQDRDELLPLWERDRSACPCGFGRKYEECCQRYHQGEVEPTAESLMRARFSAYVKKDVDYVVKTTHPRNPSFQGSKRPDGTPASTLPEDVRATMKRCAWQRLKMMSCRDGSNADEAFVKFQVWFKVTDQQGYLQKGKVVQHLIEDSRFVQEDGRWLYIDGKEEHGIDTSPTAFEKVNQFLGFS